MSYFAEMHLTADEMRREPATVIRAHAYFEQEPFIPKGSRLPIIRLAVLIGGLRGRNRTTAHHAKNVEKAAWVNTLWRPVAHWSPGPWILTWKTRPVRQIFNVLRKPNYHRALLPATAVDFIMVAFDNMLEKKPPMVWHEKTSTQGGQIVVQEED